MSLGENSLVAAYQGRGQLKSRPSGTRVVTITITQIQCINVQQIFVVTFEFTGATRGFMIMSCAAHSVKKVGQH